MMVDAPFGCGTGSIGWTLGVMGLYAGANGDGAKALAGIDTGDGAEKVKLLCCGGNGCMLGCRYDCCGRYVGPGDADVGVEVDRDGIGCTIWPVHK